MYIISDEYLLKEGVGFQIAINDNLTIWKDSILVEI